MFRIRQTPKNRCTYQFFSPAGRQVPAIAISTAPERGCGDAGGCFSLARIGKNNSDEKNQKSGKFNPLYRGVGKTSLDITTSPPVVTHTCQRGAEEGGGRPARGGAHCTGPSRRVVLAGRFDSSPANFTSPPSGDVGFRVLRPGSGRRPRTGPATNSCPPAGWPGARNCSKQGPSSGMWDVLGCFYHARIGENNSDEKNKNQGN